MSVSLPTDLAEGTYTVRWHTLSAEDGDEDSGEFTFTISSAAATDAEPLDAATTPTPQPTDTPIPATPTPLPTAPAAQTDGGLPCLGGTAVLMLGLAAVLGGRRRARRSP